LLLVSDRTWLVVISAPLLLAVVINVEGLSARRGLYTPITYKQVALLWLYIGFWAPSAVLFSLEGPFLNPVFWPIFPLLVLAKLIREIVRILKKSTRHFKDFLERSVQDWKEMLMDGVLSMFSFLGMIFVISLLLFLGAFSVAVVLMIPYSKVILGSGLVILFLITIVSALYQWVADLINWRNWRQSQPGALSSEEFITCVDSYNFQRYRIRFIRTVRTRGLLVISQHTEETIYNFARELESPQAPTEHPSTPNKLQWIIGLITKQGQTEYHKSGNRLPVKEYRYGVAVLDEVLRLLEQIRAAA